MKKLLACFLTLTLLISIITVYASADFGSGARVVANDVDVIKTGLVGKKLTFSDADFKSALCLTDFESITVTKIPSSTEGTLLIGGRRVGEGTVIKRKNLSSLVFIPASEAVKECSFRFTVDGYAGGSEIECTMKFIEKVNYAPSAGEESVDAIVRKTQENIPLYSTLSASDPEGDKIEFIIVTYPKKGAISFVDKESGRYSYAPNEGYTGSDKFTYVARDEYGNYSKPVTVKLKVTERMCDTVYIDMLDRSEYGAAVAMTAMNIMGGSRLGDDLYFNPDLEVTRAEFVTMAMKCAGIRQDSTLSGSFFDDDDEIPPSLRGYIATAQRIGLVNGNFENGELLFSPNEAISKYEAARILKNLIGDDLSIEESVFATDDDIPVWARSGVYAMYSLGIFDADSGSVTENVTRADVASYLYRLAEIL